MKTTIESPDALVKQVKLRAVREGKKLKDAVAELLRKELAAPMDDELEDEPEISRDPVTGLPVIKCKHAAPLGEENTPERLASILLAQEVSWHVNAGR
jgi:hypothetical protein